jgi:hypothetical protein
MPTSYTSLLGLALPVTGELSGTWGDTVNDYITQYLDAAVAGAQTISGSQTAVTLSKTTASSLTQAGSGSTGSSQYQIINCTGNPAGLLTITAPAASKVYLVLNSTSTSQSVKVVGAGPTTGVTMVSGEKALIAWDGSDFVKVASSVADGVTTFSAGTTGFTPSTATSGAVTLAGTLATTNGGTGLTSFTANGVVYASSTSALTTGSALVFDGTNLGIGTSSPAVRLQVSSGEARARLTATNASGGSWELVSGGGGVAGAGFFSLYDVGNNAQKIVVAPSSGEAIRIDGSNNVGIGTSSPSTRLTIGGYSSANQTPDIQITRSSSGTAIQTGPNITFGDGTTNNTTTLQVTQGRFGVWNYGSGAWNERFSIDAAGNAGLGVTPSAFGAGRWMQFLSVSAVGQQQNGTANLACNAYESSANSFNYILSAAAARYNVTAGAHQWYTAPSGTAGNAISFTQAMTLDASGNWLLGETSPVYGSRATISYNPSTHNGPIILSSSAFNTNNGAALWLGGKYDTAGNYRPFAGVLGLKENATDGNSAGYISFRTNGNAADPTERARITSAGFTQPVAYADTVSALGNTGTATTINLLNANVFTATLTGNCTFTLSNPIATGSSSFTLILTNDGTAGRTVAWAGGSFVFPGGASALSRTTTANAVDVWVFFTPNGGTTWYGNIAMKDMKA